MALRHLHSYLIKYFVRLTTAFHELPALIGFFLFLTIFSQILSGIALSFSAIPESMYLPLAREEEDSENLYTDDFFWMHERGVDLIVIFLFAHLFRKLHIGTNNFEQEFAWKSGAMLFLAMQVVIFLGLVLCCTHLSDVTLTIALNAFNTICLFIGKLYWIIFPDQSLNTDTLVRLAYAHYLSALLVGYFGVYHGIDMHYDWKNEAAATGLLQELNWFDEVLANEFGQFLTALWVLMLLCVFIYTEPEALHYELFMWGDIGMVTDVRFFGVAPHWYFRPYMGWLVACPFHYTGLAGLAGFFLIFYFQPNILSAHTFCSVSGINSWLLSLYTSAGILSHRKTFALAGVDPLSWYYTAWYAVALCAVYYTFSYLPYGRFFNRLGGNGASLLAYAYIYFYFGTTILRVPHFFNLTKKITAKC